MNKKIGLIIGTLPALYNAKTAGGIATHIDGLVKQLKKEGISIYMCYHKPFGISHPEILASTILEWCLYVTLGGLGLFFNKNIRMKDYPLRFNVQISFYYGLLSRYLNKINPDFIHIHSLYNPAAIVLDLIGYRKNIIITDHGFWVDINHSKPKITRLLKRNFNIAKYVIYISDQALLFHNKKRLGNLNKLKKISNPSDFSHYPSKATSSSSYYVKNKIIIFNGYNDSMNVKGLPFLLDAVNSNEYLCMNVELYLICNQEAHTYVKNGKWNFSYKLFEKMPFDKILQLYSVSDILVVPSRNESFGLVYTEALAVGIPIIGYHKMVNEFSNTLQTYIGEPIDILNEQPSDLATKIIKTLNKSINREEIKKMIVSAYSWENNIQKFLNLYYD